MLSALKIAPLVFLFQPSVASRAHDDFIDFHKPTKEPTTTTPTCPSTLHRAPTHAPTRAPTNSPTQEPTHSTTEWPSYLPSFADMEQQTQQQMARDQERQNSVAAVNFYINKGLPVPSHVVTYDTFEIGKAHNQKLAQEKK